MNTDTFIFENIRCEYLKIGQGSPLLFFPGGGLTYRSYLSLLDKLSQKYTVYAIDIPGFGNSTCPPVSWNFTQYGWFFKEFINQHKLTNVILIGHSFGGGIALQTALQSTNVSRVILVDPASAPMAIAKQTLYWAVIKKPLRQLILVNTQKTFGLIWDCLYNFVLQHLFHLRNCIRVINNCLYSEYKIPTTYHVPTTIYWGDSDQIFQGITYATWFQEQISNSVTKLVPGDHDWVIYQPEALYKELNIT